MNIAWTQMSALTVESLLTIIVIPDTNAAQHAASKINVRILISATKHAPKTQTAHQHNEIMIKDAVVRGIVVLYRFAMATKNSAITVMSVMSASQAIAV